MPSPLPIPAKSTLATFAVVVAMAGCQPSTPHPVPSVPQIGGNLKCAQGEHGYEDLQAGWSFCYPAGWKYIQRAQASQNPPGFDLALDIVNDPCGKTGCTPGEGDFAFMIISTYERGSARDLTGWIATNLTPSSGTSDPRRTELTSISWGNAQEAGRMPDGRRIALTPHHVVILDLHAGLLDLEKEMGSRLNTWKFTF